MSSNLKLGIASLFLSFLVSCSTPPPRKTLTFKEQIEVDTERARALTGEFVDRVRTMKSVRAENFLLGIVRALAMTEPELEARSLKVLVHRSEPPAGTRSFAFPGSLISIPEGFLRTVEFENELAALLSYELANILNRNLAIHVEEGAARPVPVPPVLFGAGSVFEFDRKERAASIRTGIGLLYRAGYDPRGMASIFRRHPAVFGIPDSAQGKKEVEFNVKEAQRASSELLPVLKPIVRSPEFIRFKKELERE
jgi:hypothetical protein